MGDETKISYQKLPSSTLSFETRNTDIKSKRISYFHQIVTASINLWVASVMFVKLSLFLLYLRLFKPNQQSRWLIYMGILTCILCYSAIIIVSTVLYSPAPGQRYDRITLILRARDNAKEIMYLSLGQSIFGTISDIYLLMIPIKTIFQLHMRTRRKFGVSVVFMIGIL